MRPRLLAGGDRRDRRGGRAGTQAGSRFLLVTHADYDHVCGIPCFPDAQVVAGAGAAVKLEDGSAAAGLLSGGAEWGVEWPTDLRVDRGVTAASSTSARSGSP